MVQIQPSPSVLLVDDEGSILKALQRLFRKEGIPVRTAASATEALEQLQQSAEPIALIISDQRMPKMSGAQFLERAKKLAPDAARFLLTGYSDMEAVAAAVNRGEIHRYLTKPWNDDELIAAARQAMRQFRLVCENRRLEQLTREQNRELSEMNRRLESRVAERTAEIQTQNELLGRLNARLEEGFMDAVRLMATLIDALSPRLGQVMRRTAEVARALALEAGLGAEGVRQIEAAALIHDVGLLGLPERTWERVHPEPSGEAADRYRNHPLVAEALLAPIEKLQPAAEIVRHHHEHVDGSGFPDGLKGDGIPLGARILSVAGDYCRAACGRGGEREAAAAEEPIDPSRSRAQEAIQRGAGGRYDREVAASLRKVLQGAATEAAAPVAAAPVQVEIGQLSEGMELACDLRLKDGRLLLARGTPMKGSSIESLHRLHAHGLVESRIPVNISETATRR
jgi:response regulator RpfG family c-di-GMP phosphodiesterase